MSTPDKKAMLEKVRALLAKAESTEHEAEADALTAKATELMAKYGIDKAMAEARANVKAVPSNKIVTIDEPYARVKSILINVIAQALNCQCVQLDTAGPKSHIHMFGFESDLEQIDMLYTSLLLQMGHAVNRYDTPLFVSGRSLMAERRSVMLGFINGVKPNLDAAYKVAVAQADDSGTKGKELVLASREAAVRAALRAEYPKTRSSKITYRGGGYEHGHEAGQNANIHNRPNVGSGSRALPR